MQIQHSELDLFITFLRDAGCTDCELTPEKAHQGPHLVARLEGKLLIAFGLEEGGLLDIILQDNELLELIRNAWDQWRQSNATLA